MSILICMFYIQIYIYKLYKLSVIPLGTRVTRKGPLSLACRTRRLNGATSLPWVAARVVGEGEPGG